MKLIDSSAEYIPQEDDLKGIYEGLEGIYKQIERCARTCYKSEDKITDTSAKAFVDRLIASKHFAMLEHGTVYLKIAYAYAYNKPKNIFSSGQATSTAMYPWLNTPYCRINKSPSKEDSNVYDAYITTNLRYIWEKELGNMQGIHNEFLMYRCSPTEFHEKRYTFKFITSIGIVRELIRHRVFSFANESTRYCNYSKDKFDNQLTFIKPCWFDESVDCNKNKGLDDEDFNMKACVGQDSFIHLCAASERDYLFMINEKYTPQQARDVLPLCTKSELIMTGFASDWKRLLRLRLFEETGKVHPDMKVLMEKLKAECIKNEIWDDIINSDG